MADRPVVTLGDTWQAAIEPRPYSPVDTNGWRSDTAGTITPPDGRLGRLEQIEAGLQDALWLVRQEIARVRSGQ